jgi:hypothetical protein
MKHIQCPYTDHICDACILKLLILVMQDHTYLSCTGPLRLPCHEIQALRVLCRWRILLQNPSSYSV